jgi:hypothetical protein
MPTGDFNSGRRGLVGALGFGMAAAAIGSGANAAASSDSMNWSQRAKIHLRLFASPLINKGD